MHLANVTLTVWQEMQTFRAKDHDGVVEYIITMRDSMSILHEQPEGPKTFPEAMIILTCLGQMQTLTVGGMGSRHIHRKAGKHPRRIVYDGTPRRGSTQERKRPRYQQQETHKGRQ